MVLTNKSDGRQVIAFYTISSGMSGAASSYVGEVGTEIVDILEKEGVIHDATYGMVWCIVKTGELFGAWDMSDPNMLEYLTSSNLSPVISAWWHDLWN